MATQEVEPLLAARTIAMAIAAALRSKPQPGSGPGLRGQPPWTTAMSHRRG